MIALSIINFTLIFIVAMTLGAWALLGFLVLTGRTTKQYKDRLEKGETE